VVADIAVVFQGAIAVRSGSPFGPTVLYVLTGVVGLFLLVGLWTPIAGTVLKAIFASWAAFLHPANPLSWILLGTLGGALVLLGPGGWSVDAHLFGWKRVELPDRKS
jgi:hypothetical protein